MRAWDLAVLIILIEMCIGFLAGLDGFYTQEGKNALTPQQGGIITTWQSNDSLGEFTPDQTEPSVGDYLNFGITWVLASFWLFITIVKAFVAISWILYADFHLPVQLCAFIQGVVYLIYTWGFIQWKASRGGQAFE